MTVEVRRTGEVLEPDIRRVIGRSYLPGGGTPAETTARLERLIERVAAMPPELVTALLADVRDRFAARHVDLRAVLDDSYESLLDVVRPPASLSPSKRELLGAYLSHEYAIEAAALTNPSLVLAPDQTGVGPGRVRVVVTLRAVGEGHVSSIEFRTGEVDETGDVDLDEPDPPVLGTRRQPVFDRGVFQAALTELVVSPEGTVPGDGPVERALAGLGERFTLADLDAALRSVDVRQVPSDLAAMALRTVRWLAESNYELAFPASASLSSRVVFPSGPAESHGMEDARLVRFVDDDGSVTYYGTYTAYDGYHILPQLIVSDDLTHLRIATLSGKAARNKGIALFPRRVGGRFAALARSDNERNYLMVSDHVRIWRRAEVIELPVQPWELVQVGNAGAPLETEAGWLVITHGVGPMRTYGLGAILLDLESPTRVIGHLREPLLLPEGEERDGYVPNVVYSCGQLIHGSRLIVAYGASDRTTRFASVDVDELLTALCGGT